MEPIELFDTHCHLADSAYAADLDQVLARAWEAGLAGALCVGYDLESSRAAVDLAARDSRIWAAVGLHPHYARQARAAGVDLGAELRGLARQPRVVAIGEAGLDFYRDFSPRPAQRDAFRRQIELALELDLPLLVHDRDAHDETLAILQEYYGTADPGPPRDAPGGGPGRRAPGSVPARPDRRRPAGVMHCFAGDLEMAQACLDLGFSISFAGPLTYPKADQVRAVAAAVPLDRVLVETDCPYLAPQSHRGRRNEPAYVAEVARALAGVRGTSFEETANQTTANARRLFGLV